MQDSDNETTAVQPGLPASLDAIATPAELQRTAIRIMLLSLHDGLAKMPTRIRQLPQARRFSVALQRASEFFNRSYEPARRDAELQKLSHALLTFSQVATARGDAACPWILWLYARGDLKARRRKGEANVVPLRR